MNLTLKDIHLNNCAAKTNDAGWRIIRRKSAGDVINCRCTLGYEAVREPNGKPQRLADYPPKGDIGRIYQLLNDANLKEIRDLIRQALAD